MAEHIRTLDRWVRQDQWPHIECSTCRIGALSPEFLKGTPSASSLFEYDYNGPDPSVIEGNFHGVLKCSLGNCGDRITVAGDMTVDYDSGEDGRTTHFECYKLRFAAPALDIVVPPAGTPESVIKAIHSAGKILWMDPNAAANRLRVAIEEMLTDYGMRRFVVRNHKQVRLSTHARILEFKETESQVGETLEAVKWIGNAGSHEQQLSVTDVLDGADLFGYALRLFYDKTDEEMERRIKAVNKRKGLPKKAAKK